MDTPQPKKTGPGNPTSRRSARYLLTNCTKACTLNPYNLPGNVGELLHGWFENGDNNPTIIAKAKVLEVKLTNGAVGRHRANHLQQMPGADPSEASPVERKSDLEVLEIIIGRGSQQVDLATTKISAEQLLRAIELKHKLTEGSVFESLFGALVEEGDEAFSEGGPETPAAVRSDEETAQAAPVDVD